MSWKGYAAIGALILLAAGVAYLVWKAHRWRERTAKAEADATADEIAGWEAEAEEAERQRSDQEAFQRWRENFSDGGDP